MPAVARIADVLSDTDIIAEGSGNVFVNNIPATRMADKTTGHTLPSHNFYPPVPIVTGAGSVFINNIPVARVTDIGAVHKDPPHSDSHSGIIITGSPDVFAE